MRYLLDSSYGLRWSPPPHSSNLPFPPYRWQCGELYRIWIVMGIGAPTHRRSMFTVGQLAVIIYLPRMWWSSPFPSPPPHSNPHSPPSWPRYCSRPARRDHPSPPPTHPPTHPPPPPPRLPMWAHPARPALRDPLPALGLRRRPRAADGRDSARPGGGRGLRRGGGGARALDRRRGGAQGGAQLGDPARRLQDAQPAGGGRPARQGGRLRPLQGERPR
jgi:hypothetical protein